VEYSAKQSWLSSLSGMSAEDFLVITTSLAGSAARTDFGAKQLISIAYNQIAQDAIFYIVHNLIV
jgi:hypothetical protein